jgi:hypothetical protein
MMLLRNGAPATRKAVLALIPKGGQAPHSAELLHSRFPVAPVGPIVDASLVPARDTSQLATLFAALRPLISLPSTPPGLANDVLLSLFASRVLSLPLEERPTLATPELFSLFCAILTQIPPSLLIDAICTTIDVALRHDGICFPYFEQINTSYASQVCTPQLAKALCDIIVLGREYASSPVFAALRFVIDSPEFRSIAVQNLGDLIDICDADASGSVHRAARELHDQRLLIAYSALPFPKPDFPLGEKCVFTVYPYSPLVITSPRYLHPHFRHVSMFTLLDSAKIKVDHESIQDFSTSDLKSLVVFPTLDHVFSF